jgi:mono/diheme cytochrome c family protein
VKWAVLTSFSAAALLLAQNVNYQPDAKWRAPEEAAARTNPLAEKPELAAGGRKLFKRNCVECHGDSGQGLKKAADLQLPVVQDQSDGALFWKITNGNPDHGMPSFSGIPELQRWQIVLHLRTLRPSSKEKEKEKQEP